MAKKENQQETIENAPVKEEKKLKFREDLTSYSIRELLELKDATRFLIDYYNNYAKANDGQYPFNSQEMFFKATKMASVYSKILVRIIDALEEKVKNAILQ